jgi:Bax protein
MLKFLKVILLVLILVVVSVVINEISTFDYIYPEYRIDIEEIAVTGSQSILLQEQNSIKPVKYLGTLDFDTIPESIRKVVFINYMLPAIVIEHERLLDLLRHIEFIERRMVNKNPLRSEDLQFFKEMMMKYDATSIKDLKIRLFPHPISLVLAQATLESGWGTSNVFSKANNPFGIMSFSSEEQRRKFLNPEQQTEAYFRSYSDINQSVEHYYYFTARLSSYEKFRKKRWERGSSISLVNLLKNYHETDEYSSLVESIIRKNDYEKYDLVTINKDYFKYRKNYFQLFKGYFGDTF